jgi:hypothetical protein
VKFFFDNSLSPQIAHAFSELRRAEQHVGENGFDPHALVNDGVIQ